MSYISRAIEEIDRRLKVLRTALFEATAAGVQSASVSSGGASQSYTRMSLADIRIEIKRLEHDRQLLLAGGRHRRTFPDFC